jgi:hypothetical protein
VKLARRIPLGEEGVREIERTTMRLVEKLKKQQVSGDPETSSG